MTPVSFKVEPQLIHCVQTLGWSPGASSEMPALRDGVVALTGQSHATDVDVVVLQLIDARRGVECGRVTHRDPKNEIHTGAPTFASDGSILFGLSVYNTSLEILCVERGGTVRSRDELNAPHWLVSNDGTGSSCFAPIVSLGRADVLCSVSARQGTSQWLARHRIGVTDEPWGVDDYLLASNGEVVLGASPPKRTGESPTTGRASEMWHARDVSTGAVRWSLDGANRTLLGTTNDRFVFVDRQAHALDENSPIDIVTGSLGDGRLLNRMSLKARVVGAHVDERGSVLTTRGSDGAVKLVVLNSDGLGLADYLLAAPSHAGDDGPAIVGRRGNVLFAAWERDLDAIDANTGRTLWRFAIPDARHGLALRERDRNVARRTIAVDDELLVIRGDTTLYVFAPVSSE